MQQNSHDLLIGNRTGLEYFDNFAKWTYNEASVVYFRKSVYLSNMMHKYTQFFLKIIHHNKIMYADVPER